MTIVKNKVLYYICSTLKVSKEKLHIIIFIK